MKILPIAFAALIASSQLLAQTVSVQYDEAADFTTYKTYTWKGCIFGDPNVEPTSMNRLNEKRVQQAMSEHLASKGLRELEQSADLYVTCIGGRQDNRRVETSATSPANYAGYGAYGYYGWAPGWTSERTVDWTEGLLILDLVDAKRDELAWRASCSATINDPSKIDKKIRGAVKKAFRSYPPRVRP